MTSYIGDTLSSFGGVTNVTAALPIGAGVVVPTAGRYEVKVSCGLTGSGAGSADNYNMGLYKVPVGGGAAVQIAVLDIIQSSANTNATDQGAFHVTCAVGDTLQVRAIGNATINTVQYNARLNATLETSA